MPSKHQATKRNHKHPPQEKSVAYTEDPVYDGTGNPPKVALYKHGPNYGKSIMSNHDRVTAGRILVELQAEA